MPAVDPMRVAFALETDISHSIRARTVASLFDIPPEKKCRLEWDFDFPYDAEPWSVGLVVGPSGSGKTSVMRQVWGDPPPLEWNAASIIDDFDSSLGVEAITGALSSVGFSTAPAWLRPYAVLSNGEKFRAEVARRMLGNANPVVIDEFTSVVDRQVAKVGSHAVQKFIRRQRRQFVAVTCHADLVEWLQPDWVLDMATRSFTRRLLQRRPTIDCELRLVDRSVWPLFAPFHYLSAELAVQARCFGTFVDGRIVGFTSVLHRPVSTGERRHLPGRLFGVPRLVVLPDWQGLGLGIAAAGILGSAYQAYGDRLRFYPANPALVRTFDRSPVWKLTKAPRLRDANLSGRISAGEKTASMGGRPNAVFEYVGATMPKAEAAALLEREP